jgi:hypothetical protein
VRTAVLTSVTISISTTLGDGNVNNTTVRPMLNTLSQASQRH